MRTIIAGIALLTAISITSAQEGTIVGHGVSSCAEWTESQRENSWAARTNQAWVAGYLSAYNGRIKIDIPDSAARTAWVSTYCRTYPLDTIYAAADNLLLELIRRANR